MAEDVMLRTSGIEDEVFRGRMIPDGDKIQTIALVAP